MVIADVLCGWLWIALGAWRWFWVASGGFQWFTVLVATVKFVALNLKVVDNYGEFWWYQATMTQHINFQLKRLCASEKSFFLWKLTCIALCKFSSFWLRFSPFWSNFFKDLVICLMIGWQICILGWVSDKYSYLLKPCCNYVFQVSILLYQRG